MKRLPSRASIEGIRRSVFARSVGKLWGAETLVAAMSFAQAALLARWLGPRDYGVLALVMAYPNVLYTFLDPRSSEAAVRYLGAFLEADRVDAALATTRLAYRVDVGVALVSFAAIAATAAWATSHVVHGETSAWLIVLFAGGLVLNSPHATSMAVLTSLDSFRLLARGRVVTVALRTGAALALVASGSGVAGAVVGTAAGLAVEGAVFTHLAHRSVSRQLGRSWWGAPGSALEGRRREILRFIVYTDLISLIGAVTKQLDVVILGYFRGPTQAGFYRLARSIATMADRVVTPLQAVAYPRFARLSDKPEPLFELAKHYARRVGIPMAAAGLACLPVLPFALRHLVGRDFGRAASTAQLLIAGAAVWIAFFWFRPLVLSLGEVRFRLATALVVAVVSVIGFVAVAEPFGAPGIAMVQLAVAAVGGNAVAYAYLARRYRRPALRLRGERAEAGKESG